MRIPVLALLLAFTALPQAFAETVLTPASSDITLIGNGSAIYTTLSSSPQSYSLSSTGATVTGGNTGGNTPAVQGSISITSVPPINYIDYYNMGQEFDSESYIFYQFAVNGPADQQVSINFLSSGLANVSALNSIIGLNATAYLDVFNAVNGSTLLTETACAGAASLESDPCSAVSGPLSASFSVNQLLTVTTDTAYFVNLYTSDSMVAPDLGISGNFSASSSVDPTITLATDDPAYSLEFSPGLLPAAATPEPSALLLAGTGVAALVGLVRRRLTSI